MAESDLERLDAGEVITVRPDGWLRGQLDQPGTVREELERALDRELRVPPSPTAGSITGPVDSPIGKDVLIGKGWPRHSLVLFPHRGGG